MPVLQRIMMLNPIDLFIILYTTEDLIILFRLVFVPHHRGQAGIRFSFLFILLLQSQSYVVLLLLLQMSQ